MTDRIASLRRTIHSKKLDAMLVATPAHIAYLTGFQGFSDVEREGYLLVMKRASYIFTSPLHKGAVEQLKSVTPMIFSATKSMADLLSDVIKKNQLQSIGFEPETLTVNEYSFLKKQKIKMHPSPITPFFIHKTDDEITAIKKACEIADAALANILPMIQPGLTEKHIASQLHIAILQLNGDISFPPIVAFGPNSAVPHHHTSDKRLKTKDIILIDFGAKYNGFCSDMTRTFFVEKPTAEQKHVYQTVLKAQQEAVSFLDSYFMIHDSKKVKLNASDVDNAARQYIISQGYPTIPHSLGHGIGLRVHEPPSLSPRSDDKLEEGMVFSIEPGIYIEKRFGIRIEDLYSIQNRKLVKLTASSSSLMMI